MPEQYNAMLLMGECARFIMVNTTASPRHFILGSCERQLEKPQKTAEGTGTNTAAGTQR